ncbi:DUF3343 domain-containing protein [Lachnospiraceae bacterium ZAX-1]
MRTKELHFVLTFKTTFQAIKMEKIAKDSGAPGRIIPIPREITAGCGLAYSVLLKDKVQILELIEECDMKPEGQYELMLCS